MKPIDVLEEADARKRHIAGEEYAAVCSEDGDMKYVVEILPNCIFVKFLDETKNMHLFYLFHRKNKKDLFLSSVYYYGYTSGGTKETEIITFRFWENGKLCMEREDRINGEVEERESVVDVSCNWDQFPEFGKYEHLLAKERGNTIHDLVKRNNGKSASTNKLSNEK